MKLFRLLGTIGLASVLLLHIGTAAAEEIVPESIALWNAPGIASANREYLRTKLEGRGGTLRLRYTADAPVDGFIAPARADGAFAFGDLLHFALAPGQEHDVTVPVSRSPAWSPLADHFSLTFLPQTGKTITVQTAVLEPDPVWTLPVTAVRQLAEEEPYKVSTYHVLTGYRVFGWRLVPLLGVLMILAAFAVLVWTRGNLRSALAVILTGIVLYQARFGIDLLRFSYAHAREWYGEGTYASAESMYNVASFLRGHIAGTQQTEIFVCSDAPNYNAKLLRYLLYPRRVHEKLLADRPPTHVVATRDAYWQYGKGVLTCGAIIHNANQLHAWPDGTAVFSLSAP